MSDFWDNLPEEPSQAREEAILRAVVEGRYDPIQWSPLLCTLKDGRELKMLVYSDALKIDGFRVNVTATTEQQIVDALGHCFLTGKLADLIREQANVVIGACTQKPDSKMAYTSRTLKHSSAVDAKIAGKTGLICTVGKDWVLSNKLAGKPDLSANYGWHDPSASYTSPGGWKLWQNLGTTHDRWHVDYSQVVRLASRHCLLEGEPRDLLDLLRDPDVASLLSYEGALKLDRMPGVPVYVPATQPPQVAGGTLGERCVAWCLQHVGHKEQPSGSNDSPLIRKWLAPCARGYGDKRVVLGLSKVNWCAGFQAAAVAACLAQGEKLPHDYRAGVVELVADTSPDQSGNVPFAGRYVPLAKTLSGEFFPSVGDLAIWDRSEPGKPATSWWRHVNRVVKCNQGDGTFQTVGGNEADRVAVAEHPVGARKLLGWIHYPIQKSESLGTAPTFTEPEKERILSDVSMFLRGIADTLWRRS